MREDSFKQFLSKFNEFAEHQQVEDAKNIQVLGICLNRTALEAFESITEANPNATFAKGSFVNYD